MRSQCESTVVHFDVSHFTRHSEALDPASLFKRVEDYVELIAHNVDRYGGMITNFGGDAVLAVFGWPRPLTFEESAYLACLAAIATLKATQRWNRCQLLLGNPPFIIRAGINTGNVSAGILKLDAKGKRFCSTVLGDTVNTAERIGRLGKSYGESTVVISEAAWQALGEHTAQFESEAMGSYLVEGKSRPVATYRLQPRNSARPVGISGDAVMPFYV